MVTARAGTPLATLEALLAENQQCLPFEPPHFGPGSTVGGIVGAILTGVFASQSLGGTGGLAPDTFAMGTQVWVQTKSVLITMVWSGVVALVAYKVADVLVGLRVSEEAEREGLDITSHGETAYSR